jgi:antitoxin (DNA-binding transcriptional repressor) of toxin-antitoxin stability system
LKKKEQGGYGFGNDLVKGKSPSFTFFKARSAQKSRQHGDRARFPRLKIHKWSFRISEMDIAAVTQFKQHCLEIIRRLEKTGAPVAITRREKVVAQLQAPAVSASGRAQKPWEQLRAMGGRLLAEPGESVIRAKDFEALRRVCCSAPMTGQARRAN